MKTQTSTILLILTLVFSAQSFACTTAVISGKYTKDGRPLLWKHRDTWAVTNIIREFTDGKYTCVGLVNSSDTLGESIWIGYNDHGFGIMNSASYNLNNDTITQSGLEGRLMKNALQTCANIEDFEKFLDKLERPIRLEANFGVIDGNGGAAYFELGNFKYVKIDANDPAVAPYGYLIRTNYSFTGEIGLGGGYIRYVTANNTFYEAVTSGNLTYKTMLQGCSRNLTHSLTGTDLNEFGNRKENNRKMVFFKDFIPRSGTSSSCVVQGVLEDENPEFTTMWSIVGFPLSSVIVPVWITKSGVLPQQLQYDKELQDSPLCNKALELKEYIYPYIAGGHSDYYIDINALINADNTGIMQQLRPLESILTQRGEELLNSMRRGKAGEGQIADYYKMADNKIELFYMKIIESKN
ncbi:MAG: hypothetical protein GXO89_01895 [Chlorobi bacterium]|nr:hypothetical protein [Chlorobiota bacterium]